MAAGSIVIDILAKTGSFETNTKRAEKRAKETGASIDKAFKVGAAAVATAGAAFFAMTKSVINNADSVAKASRSIGITTESLSSLQYAAELSGISSDQLNDAFRRLNKGAADGNKAFAAMGVSVRDSQGNLKASDALLKDVSDKFASYKDGAEKSALAQELFGRSGANMISFLNSGSEGLSEMQQEAEKLGIVISGDLAKNSEIFNDNLNRIQKSVTGLVVDIAGPLVNALASITTEFLKAAQAGETFAGALERGLSGGKVGDRSTIEKSAQDIEKFTAKLKDLDREIAQYKGQEIPIELQFKRDVASADLAAALKDYTEKANKIAIPLPPPPSLVAPTIGAAGGQTKDPKEKEFVDSLTDSAKAYASAMDSINRAQVSAAMSGQNLTSTQQTLLALFASPEFLNMPDEWKRSVVEAGEFAIKQEQINENQARLNELLGESGLEKQREDMMLLSEAFENGSISAEQYGEAVKNALGLEDEDGSYWDRWLQGAQEAMTSFNDLASAVINNFTTGFGNAFEKIIFDSQSLSDAVKGLTESMARSVVNALGQMAAQWVAQEAVKRLASLATTSTVVAGTAAQTSAGLASNAAAATSAVATGATITAAMAPAAVATSVATGGVSTGTAIAAIVAALALIPMFAGSRERGGDVIGGRSYLVGENGPEMFTPRGTGTITPNGGGGGGGIVQNINISTGVAQTVRAEIMTLMPQIISAAKSAVSDSRMRGGSYGNSMR